MLDLGQICILVMKMSYSYWFKNIKKKLNSDFCGRRTFAICHSVHPPLFPPSVGSPQPSFAPRRRRIRNCNGRSFGGDVYLKQHAVSRHNVTPKMGGGAGEREQRPSVPGDDKWGVGRWEGTSEPASERKNEAPLDCARQRRINPLAGARRGFCARRRRDDVNVKRSSRAVG